MNSPWTRLATRAPATVLRHGRAPLVVSWVVTHHCNLRCGYCDCPTTLVRELTTEQALDVIDGLAQLGAARVHLTGGEPLVRKDLDALVARLRYFGMRVGITTNGTLVPRRLELLESLHDVALSLDGPPEIHDVHRGEGQHADVLAALEAMQARRPAELRLLCLLTATTTETAIAHVLEIAARFGASAFFQPALDEKIASGARNPLAPSQTQLSALLRVVAEHKRAGAPVGSSHAALRDLAAYPDARSLSCPVNRVAVRLDATGTLLPCHERAAAPDGESVLGPGGVVGAFARLKLKQCTECWGSGRVELRLAATGRRLAG